MKEERRPLIRYRIRLDRVLIGEDGEIVPVHAPMSVSTWVDEQIDNKESAEHIICDAMEKLKIHLLDELKGKNNDTD